MELKVTTLIENNIDDKEELINEHGLSMFIEFDGKRILFDTGQTGDFLLNAKKLGVDVKDIDYFLISHGHYDHSGGLGRFSNTLDKKVNLYVGEEFFNSKYKIVDNNEYKYNGNPFRIEDINDNVRIKKVSKDITYLSDNIIIFKNFDRTNDFEQLNKKFFIKNEDSYILDEFKDEIALGLITSKGLVVFVGCSHVGIINILQTISKRVDVPIFAVIGGTHLVDADNKRLLDTILSFKKLGIGMIGVSHCTGETGIEMVKSEFLKEFVFNNTGNIIEI